MKRRAPDSVDKNTSATRRGAVTIVALLVLLILAGMLVSMCVEC